MGLFNILLFPFLVNSVLVPLPTSASENGEGDGDFKGPLEAIVVEDTCGFVQTGSLGEAGPWYYYNH